MSRPDDQPLTDADFFADAGGENHPGATSAAIRSAAERLMRRREWSEAASQFARIAPPDRDVSIDIKQRLSANLAALEIHRPVVYEMVVALPAQQDFSLGATPSGKPTINVRRTDGSLVALSSGPDPLAAAGAAVNTLYKQTPTGEAVAVCGFGDGYVAQVLAHNPPRLFMDRQQPIFLIEPQPQVVLHCLMIHDYTGPIEQSRFQWLVGGGWDRRLEQMLRDDVYLPCPMVMLGQGFDVTSIQARLREILRDQAHRIEILTTAIERHYASANPSDLATLFTGAGPRRPRVLLVTTRFSTVLQYSTGDTAAAFERLGWNARVIIEPSPHHRVLRTALADALSEFQPDLVFQIDHLRHEHQGLFPENLPFACWIQDHLPHLASRDVGSQVGPLDFVLTDTIDTYVEKFAYPKRQCIALPKLVVHAEPATVDESGALPADDIVFVSNASHTPETMVADAVARFARNAETRELIELSCRRMIETYAAGQSVPTYFEVCALLRLSLDELALTLPADGFDVLARWLTHPFNDALYRQQALGWAQQVAREQRLTLGLYGKGWESHPRFAPHARGPVAYGEPLRQLTRRSRINLQIVPYLCLHQRLLDGLLAGGFFLIRTHPADLAPATLLDFLDAHGGVSARTFEDAFAAIPPAQRNVLAALIEQSRPPMCTTGAEDVIAMARSWQESGQLISAVGPLPMLDAVAFHDAQTLAEKVQRFVADAPARAAISTTQRRSVAGRLSYDAGVRRVVVRIAALLAESAGAAAVPIPFVDERAEVLAA